MTAPAAPPAAHGAASGPAGPGLLFTPIRVGDATLPNRIVLAAMVTRLSGEDGFVNERIRERYLRFARGEPGLLIVEATAVHGSKSGPLLRLGEDRFTEGHAVMVDRIHRTSPSRVALQVIHFLKLARSGWRQQVTDLTGDDLARIPDQYATAAARAREAGYDGVELHMAHAYTLSSFLSRLNRRTDSYGGSLENRLRLPSEVLKAVRREVGTRFPVGVRFDGEECIKNGYSVEEAKIMALRFAGIGANWISLSAGGKFEDAVKKEGHPLYPYTGYSGDRTMPAVQYPDLANLYIAETVKEFLRSHGSTTPVITTGKIRTSAQMEAILSSGKADMIGLARGLLADPDLPRKIRDGREETVVGCVYANVCKNLDENFREVRCFLWPKGSLQAPLVDDRIPPRWKDGARWCRAKASVGRIQLEWPEAEDPQGVSGYEILRAEGDGPPAPYTKHPAYFHRRWFDTMAVGGLRYRYSVRAYDFAGNRSEPTEIAVVEIAPGDGPPGGDGP